MKFYNSELYRIFKSYADPRLLIIGILGFACGTPLLLTSSTLSIWLKEYGFDNTTIGFFGVLSLPYSLRFLWAPMVDRMPLPYLTKKFGRRRSWLLFSQAIMILVLGAFSFIDIKQDLMFLSILSMILAFTSATHWTAMIAYQVENFQQRQYGPVEGMTNLGYRLGMVASSAGALYIAHLASWEMAYSMMGFFILMGFLVTLYVDEPKPIKNEQALLQEKKAEEYLKKHQSLNPIVANTLSWLYAAVICPFINFMTQKNWFIILILMFLYKAGDNFIGSMSNVFYLELGFSKIEIANASKLFGMMAAIVGSIIGGGLIARWGFLKSLYINAILHMFATGMYIIMAYVGNDTSMLYTSIAIEHITGGMRTTALLSYQLKICTPSYAATQLALMASVVSLGRTFMAPISGVLVTFMGWKLFFTFAVLASLPAILLVRYLSTKQDRTNLAADI